MKLDKESREENTKLKAILDKINKEEIEFVCKHCGTIQKPKVIIKRITDIEKIKQAIRDACKE